VYFYVQRDGAMDSNLTESYPLFPKFGDVPKHLADLKVRGGIGTLVPLLIGGKDTKLRVL